MEAACTYSRPAMRHEDRPGLQDHAVALGALAAALALRLALEPWLHGQLPFVTIYGAVALAAWRCGSRPALLAAVLGGPIALQLLPGEGRPLWISLGGYALSAGLIVWMGHALRRDARALALQVRQRQAAEQAALAAAERLHTTLHSIGDGVIVADAQGRVSAMNPVAEALTAWPAAEALGRPLEQVFDIVDEGRRMPVPNPALRAIAAGRVVGLANHTLLRARDGRERPIDDSAAPLRTRDGEVDGAVLVFRDCSPRRSAERELQRSEGLLRSMYESSTLCMGVLELADGGLRHLQDNAGTCRLYRVPPGATVGRRPAELGADAAVVARWTERGRACIASGAPLGFEFAIPRAGRAPLWHRATLSPLPIEPGQAPRITYVSEDITARREAEHLQAQADRRRNEFLATLAHELRNPLAPIANGLALLRRSGDDTLLRERTVLRLERQLALMVRLIDDLLDVHRITHDRLELRRGTIDLVAAVQDGLDSGEPLLAAQGHRLQAELPPQPVWVDGDAARLSQVLANLLSNAARYTPPGGHVRVALQVVGEQAVLTVEDDGIGIPPDLLGRVFELYAQVDRATLPARAGLGIGLAICRRLVELHGGRIQAASDGEGRGSRFVVTLPCVAAPADAAVPLPLPAAARGQRVLVVDDNVDAAESLRELLVMLGHQVAVAHDGPAALALAAQLQPQLALLDLGLPGMDGCELADRLRQRPALATLRLVALTGWGQAEDRARTQAHGFHRHLVKPVDPRVLERLLAED